MAKKKKTRGKTRRRHISVKLPSLNALMIQPVKNLTAGVRRYEKALFMKKERAVMDKRPILDTQFD